MKYVFLTISLLILFTSIVSADSGEMIILAVSETDAGFYGGTADLLLEVEPGAGRVFLETFPFTKTDTQMSTRFAKDIACDYLDIDCSQYDFFYTIRADSAIIAGPSAGASIAALTVSVLNGDRLKNDIAVSGTINSGGLIGPVGGLNVKIRAAAREGIREVLIPKGASLTDKNSDKNDTEDFNETITAAMLSEELGIKVTEVSTLDDVLVAYTGKKPRKHGTIQPNNVYSKTMKILANDLCERSEKLQQQMKSIVYEKNATINITASKETANNLSQKGSLAYSKDEYYSAASYCYGSNIEYTNLLLFHENLSSEQIIKNVTFLKQSIEELDDVIESVDKTTITDLETFMIVKERLSEASSYADNVLDSINSTVQRNRNLALAIERLKSAHSWAQFMGSMEGGKTFTLDAKALKTSCQSKIFEVEERMQYVSLYFPSTLVNVGRGVRDSRKELASGNYELCLFKASKAKADVDIILSVFGVEREQLDNILETKLMIVNNVLADQTANGIFPLLGYSYYEYANSLSETDTISALIYTEYALELGNLDMYFKKNNGGKRTKDIFKEFFNEYAGIIMIFSAGLLSGIITTHYIFRKERRLHIHIKHK